jgi:hypothetical protein
LGRKHSLGKRWARVKMYLWGEDGARERMWLEGEDGFMDDSLVV